MRAHRALALLAIGVTALAGLVAVTTFRERIVKLLPPRWHIALSTLRHGVSVDHDVVIDMRDGTRLAASLYLPRGEVRRATILIRTPYGRLRDRASYVSALDFVQYGYAAVVADLRGTGESGGEFLPWRDADRDGAATLDWIAKQPWSDGKVGTYGCSALGETQFALAKERHPAHRAMLAAGAGGAVGTAANRYNYFSVFEGGVPQLASAVGWFIDSGAKDPNAPPAAPHDRERHLRRLPVATLASSARGSPTGLEDYLSTPLADPRWSGWGFLAADDRIEPPLFLIDTWGDQGVGATLALAEALRRSDPAKAERLRVVVGPTPHCHHDKPGPGPFRFGEIEVRNASRPWDEWERAWFDHWLLGAPAKSLPRAVYHYFMIGEDRWLDSGEWPPAQARVARWHLDGHRANSRAGDGALATVAPALEATDTFQYDPADPVPSRGGPVCCTGLATDRPGPAEQSDVEKRADVLVYTSPPLEAPLRIAGPVKARLTVSSSAPDTDLVARIAHVFPDGRSIGVQEGALRLRYRNGFAAPAPIEPGKRYEVEVDMRSIAYTIPRGHRLRLHVTSSSFPRLERNLNTGAANNSAETALAVATSHIHHGGGASAWLELAVLPNEP